MDQNKVLTILEVKDHLGEAIAANKAKMDQLTAASKKFDDSIDQVSSNASRNMGRFDGALTSIKNNMGLLIKGGALLGGAVAAGMAMAVNKAIEFESKFRELDNLNLDKTDEQISKLRENVLKTSSDTGKAAGDMSKAFFDIQSGTGFYGKEVDDIARKTADFSKAFKVDFGTATEGVVKGIRNFGLGAKDMDMFFGSMVKTVQTGIVTFEQLAKVQTDYSGAANAAGQSVDSANKLYSVFTTKTKSFEEAATLTKGAFQDLLKPATLQAFDKFGVQVFDKQTGKVKQLDEIVRQLNDRFKGAAGNDKNLSKLINQFSGNEGLIALVQEAAKNGDAMLKTFSDFDNVDVNIGKALEKAKKDVAVMSEEAKNKFEVTMIRIGTIALPTVIEGLEYINNTLLPGFEARLPEIEKGFNGIGSVLRGLKDGFLNVADTLEEFSYVGQGSRQKEGRKALKELGFSDKDIDNMEPRLQHRVIKASHETFLEGKIGSDADTEVLRKLQTKRFGFLDVNKLDGTLIAEKMFAGKYANDYARENALGTTGLRKDEAERRALLDAMSAKTKGGGLGDSKSPTDIVADKAKTQQDKYVEAILKADDSSMKRGLDGVGGKSSVRTINITINKQVGIENLTTTTVHESRGDIEEQLREAMIKSVRDAEVGISSAME